MSKMHGGTWENGNMQVYYMQTYISVIVFLFLKILTCLLCVDMYAKSEL
jgi:hypothetical protein